MYHLWEFIRDQLDNNEDEELVVWESKSDGVFRILDSKQLASSWGDKKTNKKKMTYEKMSRSLR